MWLVYCIILIMIEKEVFEPRFQELNPEMKAEIDSVILDGYEVSVGCTQDRAYEKPHEIEKMFNELNLKGKIYADLCSEIIKADLGVESLESVPDIRIRNSRKRNEDRFEEYRAELLFDDMKMPWHLQRGSALALMSIDAAHNFIICDGDSKGGLYDRMCGRLSLDPDNFVFKDGDNSLAGFSLRDAVIKSHQRFGSDSYEDASQKADLSLAKLDAFLNAPITSEFKDIVSYCYDGLGIRNRKQEVYDAISGHINNLDNPKDDMLMISVGCGTALSILEVASDVKSRGINPHVILLDQDPIALAAAKSIAEQMGLADAIELHCESLFDAKGQPLDMLKIINGRKLDIAEDTGLREYLPDPIYKNLTNALWESLADDGIMTTGNMNLNRSQPEFLHGLMGWHPNVIMRNISKGFSLHEESGIPKGNTRARVTRDGVYTLFFSTKKEVAAQKAMQKIA